MCLPHASDTWPTAKSWTTAAVGTFSYSKTWGTCTETSSNEVAIGEHPLAAFAKADKRAAFGAWVGDLPAVYKGAGFVATSGPGAGGEARLMYGHWPDAAIGTGPPRVTLSVCTTIDGAADGGGALREFAKNAAAAGAGAVFVYDIGAESAIAAWWRALDGLDAHAASTRLAVIRAPPHVRSPVAAYRVCSRAHAPYTDWIMYLGVRERLSFGMGAASSAPVLRNASIDAVVVPIAGACGGGSSGAPCGSPRTRVLARPMLGAVASTALPCVRSLARVVDGTGAPLPRGTAACNCAREGSVTECGVYAGRNNLHSLSLTVCTTSAAARPARVQRRAPRNDTLAVGWIDSGRVHLRGPCPSVTVSVECGVPRVGLLDPPAPYPTLGRLKRGWTAARRDRTPRLAHVTMVFGTDVDWVLRRLAFTVSSLRAVGTVAPIFVLVPDAAWAAAGTAAIPGVSFLVSDYVPTPEKCKRVSSDSQQTSAGVYLSPKYVEPMYMQFSALLLTRFDAVVYIDALDVHVRAPLERALAEFEGSSAAFAAAPESGRSCASEDGVPVGTGIFNAGVQFMRPSRALYRGVSRYGDEHPGGTACALANQDVLNEAIPALLGTSLIGCLGPDVHYMPMYADFVGSAPSARATAGLAAVTHFLGKTKPWLPDPPKHSAQSFLLDAVRDYRSAYCEFASGYVERLTRGEVTLRTGAVERGRAAALLAMACTDDAARAAQSAFAAAVAGGVSPDAQSAVSTLEIAWGVDRAASAIQPYLAPNFENLAALELSSESFERAAVAAANAVFQQGNVSVTVVLFTVAFASSLRRGATTDAGIAEARRNLAVALIRSGECAAGYVQLVAAAESAPHTAASDSDDAALLLSMGCMVEAACAATIAAGGINPAAPSVVP